MKVSGRLESAVPDWATAFQEAALDPPQWLAVLQRLADATGSSRAELVGFGSPGFRSFNWVTSMDETLLGDFFRAGGTSPAANFRVAADDGASILEVLNEAHYSRVRGVLRYDDYLDFCEQNDMVFGCQTTLHRPNGGLVGMSLLRSRAEGRTDDKIHATFTAAAQAARTAVRMQALLEDQGVKLLTGTLEAMSLACILLDGVGSVRFVSPAAEEVIRRNPLLTVVEHRIHGSGLRVRRQIDHALRAILGPAQHPHVRVVLGQNIAELVLDLFALPVREWSMHFAPSAIVIFRDPQRGSESNAAVLRSALGLTAAELEIALALYRGTSRARLAAERGVTVDTVRSQIRSIYSKAECRREAELIALMRMLLE